MWALVREPCDTNLARARSTTARSTTASARGRWILAATILASSMAFIDGTVVNVALPALQTQLNATALDVQWVVEAYALLLSAFLLIGGSLGDHYGRRRIFLSGVLLFATASAACGCAQTIRQLIAARALQGFAAALLVPGSLALISSSFPEDERGRAIGTWSGLSAITTALGPLIGGWLIEHVSWRAVFFINLPLALAIILISLRHVPENRDRERARVDWLGATLAVTGLGALVYALIESSRLTFHNSSVISVLAVAAVALVAFVVLESRLANPMLPLALFRSRTFAGANALTFLLYAALGGAMFFLPLNLIQVQHFSATAAGAALLPFIVIMSILSRWSGGLVRQYGARLPLIVGPVIAAIGYILFMRPGAGGNYWPDFFPAIATLGLGMAITVAPLTTTVMSSVAEQHAGIASGTNNAIARTAGLIAIAVLGIVMLHVFDRALQHSLTNQHLPGATVSALHAERTKLAAIAIPNDVDLATRAEIARAIDSAFVTAFRTIMAIGAALALASAIIAALLISHYSVTTPRSTSTA